VRLPDQSFQILAMLLEHPRELVTREEIRQSLWPGDTFVDFDHGLNNAMNRLREALGDSADSPRFIETLPRRGYRFLVKVDGIATRPVAAFPSDLPASAKPAERRSHRNWALVAPILTVLSLMVLAIGAFRARIPGSAGRVSSLVVLPLENVSGDAAQDYFADGMTDALITNLAGLRSVRVISRTSAMHYKGSHKALPEIARELDVDAVVEGTVSKAGDRVRINAQLIDARNDRHIWAAKYERDLRDVLALQAELADAISNQVASRLDTQRQSLLSKKKVNPEAYENYLRGRYEASHGAFTTEGWRKARGYFNRAIQLDPSSAEAVLGLAETYIVDDPAAARLLASKALELDDSSAEAHAIVATVIYEKDWDVSAAEKEFRRALELDPNSVPAHDWYGLFLAFTGRFDEAIHELRYAERLDPLGVTVGCDMGLALYLARRYDEAIDQLQKVLRQDPDFQMAHRHLMRIYGRRDQIPEYINAFAKAPGWFDLTPEQAQKVAQEWRGTYAAAGAQAFWRRRLDFELRRRAPHNPSPRQAFPELARVYTHLGDSDHAIAVLQEAYDRRDHMLVIWIRTDPEFDNVRSDPRFQALLKQIGFPQ
jgi:TolB-like protein/DNA-binding winged helix-turn-helix (wHTH) protein/Tfp pilus assembly protein PilF